MEKYRITMDEYSKALAEASDSAYLAHLVNDFRITDDGMVIARWTVDTTLDGCYTIRDRFKLFSSL